MPPVDCRPLGCASRSRLVAVPWSFLIVLSASSYAPAAHAIGNKVSAFGVTDYSACPGATDLPNAVPAAQNFYDKLVDESGGTWIAGFLSENTAVRGRRMADPDWSGDTNNDDNQTTGGFDYNYGITFFQGHGTGGNWHDGHGDHAFDDCPNGNPATDCNAPPSSTYAPTVCMQYPKPNPCPAGESCIVQGLPFCAAQYNHRVVACRANEGSVNFVNYSRTNSGEAPPEMRLGEGGSPWAMSGDAGGTQLAVIFSSHAVNIGAPGQNVKGMFGGMDLLLTAWTHYGDYADVSDRAPTFAQAIVDLPNATLSQIVGLASPLIRSGGGCKGWKNNGTPRQGINGCSGHMLIALESTNARASTRLNNHTVLDLQNLSIVPQGNGARALLRTCNYDCVTYPPLTSTQQF